MAVVQKRTFFGREEELARLCEQESAVAFAHAKANIFGAGLAVPPEPGGGGAGRLPAVWRIPPSARVVTFPRVAGRVLFLGSLVVTVEFSK
ncbi:MAG: hypothetical protein WD689_02300 [Gaiellaceae bacterium]